MNFEFATATRIVFGPGSVHQLGAIAAEMGQRALLVTNLPVDNLSAIEQGLAQRRIACTVVAVTGEPTIDSICKGVRVARQNGCDLAIGFGGGSAIDSAKAIAALLTNSGNPLDYLEVVGRGRPITYAPLPMIAVPTTAGTGAEVTRNAVIGSPQLRVKVSLRSPLMLPRLALVDPELTYGLPPGITASTGLDALTQLIEPFVSNRANPLTDGICRDGMLRAARSLRRVYEQGDDVAAREDMSLAALFGGLALANAGLGVVHGLAGVLGGMYAAPHGAICARLLPFVMEVNTRALQARIPESTSLSRYTDIAQLLTGEANATILSGIAWVQELCTALRIPPLSAYGVSAGDFPAIVGKAIKASSTKANPIQLTSDEMGEILQKAL